MGYAVRGETKGKTFKSRMVLTVEVMNLEDVVEGKIAGNS